MTKKVFISLIVSLSVVVVAVLTISLIFGLDNNKLKLKKNELTLSLGAKYAVSDLVDGSEFKTIFDGNYFSLEHGMLEAKKCGETTIAFAKGRKSVKLPVKIFANNATFDKTRVIVYLNDEPTCSLSFLVNGQLYKNSLFTFDKNIIDYDGETLTAKSLGNTIIVVKETGENGFLYATCEVEVRNKGFFKGFKVDEYALNIDQEADFDLLSFTNGDPVAIQLIYDEEFVKIENGKIKALKLGSTQIEARGLNVLKVEESHFLTLNIEEELQVAEVSFFEGETSVTKLMVGTKSDGKFSIYTMKITYNKAPKNEPSLAGLVIRNFSTKDNSHYVEFTKSDLLDIEIACVDANDLSVAYFSPQVEMDYYLQEIVYDLRYSNNEKATCLHIFDVNYYIEASADGIFYYASLIVSDKVRATTDGEILGILNNNVFGYEAGEGKVLLEAVDGSGLTKEITIPVYLVEAEEIRANDFECNVGQKCLPTVYVQPIYALTNFKLVVSDEFVREDLVTIKAGRFDFEIVDDISGLRSSATLVVYPNFATILLNGEPITSLELSVEDSVALKIDSEFDDISVKFYDGEYYSETTDIVLVSPALGLYVVTGLKSGVITIVFYISANLVANLVVTIT